MAFELDFIAPGDKPALLALSTPQYLATAKTVLLELGYKVHAIQTHEDFISRFGQIPYQVFVTETLFAATTRAENITLVTLQNMPMALRRHATTFLLGSEYQSLNAMQALQQSVHAVVHPQELGALRQIVQQVVADTALFLNVYRETQRQIAAGRD